jgi:hypothetical protein
MRFLENNTKPMNDVSQNWLKGLFSENHVPPQLSCNVPFIQFLEFIEEFRETNQEVGAPDWF